jgi:hypothetical protein
MSTAAWPAGNCFPERWTLTAVPSPIAESGASFYNSSGSDPKTAACALGQDEGSA